MAERPPSSLDDLKKCLKAVREDPVEQLDRRLLEKFTVELNGKILSP